MPTAPGPRVTHRVGGTRAGGVARSATGGGANTSTPCHCEGVRSTLKTLSYDCGNPVQYVCGHSPAVLFYLLDRHAPLAMTKGTKWIIPQSLTTPALRATPPMEGNSARNGNVTSSPLRRGARRAGWFIARSLGEGWFNAPPHKSGKNQIIRRVGRMNAHRPRAPRDVSRGWNPGGGCRT